VILKNTTTMETLIAMFTFNDNDYNAGSILLEGGRGSHLPLVHFSSQSQPFWSVCRFVSSS